MTLVMTTEVLLVKNLSTRRSIQIGVMPMVCTMP